MGLLPDSDSPRGGGGGGGSGVGVAGGNGGGGRHRDGDGDGDEDEDGDEGDGGAASDGRRDGRKGSVSADTIVNAYPAELRALFGGSGFGFESSHFSGHHAQSGELVLDSAAIDAIDVAMDTALERAITKAGAGPGAGGVAGPGV
jgi:hypothetical protein